MGAGGLDPACVGICRVGRNRPAATKMTGWRSRMSTGRVRTGTSSRLRGKPEPKKSSSAGPIRTSRKCRLGSRWVHVVPTAKAPARLIAGQQPFHSLGSGEWAAVPTVCQACGPPSRHPAASGVQLPRMAEGHPRAGESAPRSSSRSEYSLCGQRRCQDRQLPLDRSGA